jgi:hypothetical protein
MGEEKRIQDQIDEITREVRKRLEKELLEKVREEFHRRMETKLRETLREIERKPSPGPPEIVRELLDKLDETKDVDAGVIFGSVWRTKYGTNSSSLSSFTGLESWLKVPDSYVAKVVQPFTDPMCLAILKAFLDGAKKTREELQEASGLGGDELEELLMKLMELRYIRSEVERLVKKGEVISRELFSIDHRYGLTLLLILLQQADEQRKYEEE